MAPLTPSGGRKAAALTPDPVSISRASTAPSASRSSAAGRISRPGNAPCTIQTPIRVSSPSVGTIFSASRCALRASAFGGAMPIPAPRATSDNCSSEPNASTATSNGSPAAPSARLSAERIPQPSWLSTHGKRDSASSVSGPSGSGKSRAATSTVGCVPSRVALSVSGSVVPTGTITVAMSSVPRSTPCSSAGDQPAVTRSVRRGNASRSRSIGCSSASSDRNGGTPIRSSPVGSLSGVPAANSASTALSTLRASAYTSRPAAVGFSGLLCRSSSGTPSNVSRFCTRRVSPGCVR